MLFHAVDAPVFGAERPITTVLYCCLQERKKSGELAFSRGKLPPMAKGKTSSVPGGKTENVLGVEPVRKKIGRPLKVLSADTTKKAIEAARLGIPLERIAIGCGFFDSGQGWQNYLARNPDFANAIKQAQFEGELELTSVVRQCGNGWQGSAWLLERTRGYVARAQLEHTGKGEIGRAHV